MFFLLPMSMSLADVFEFVVRYCRPVTQCQMIATPLYCVVSILFTITINIQWYKQCEYTMIRSEE